MEEKQTPARIVLNKVTEKEGKNQTKNAVTYDYFDESNHPKEWANIEKGSDIFKLTKTENNVIRLIIVVLGGAALIGVISLIKLIL